MKKYREQKAKSAPDLKFSGKDTGEEKK
jgi:hypothetical protein